MKKIITILIVGIFILSGLGVVALNSDWTTLEVTMPMNQNSIDSPLLMLLQKMMQRFPILEHILSSIKLLN